MKHKFAGLLMAGVMMCSMAVSTSAAEVTCLLYTSDAADD